MPQVHLWSLQENSRERRPRRTLERKASILNTRCLMSLLLDVFCCYCCCLGGIVFQPCLYRIVSVLRIAGSVSCFRHYVRRNDLVVLQHNPQMKVTVQFQQSPCQNCSQGPHAEQTGRGSLLNRPSCPPDDPIGQGTELN